MPPLRPQPLNCLGAFDMGGKCRKLGAMRAPCIQLGPTRTGRLGVSLPTTPGAQASRLINRAATSKPIAGQARTTSMETAGGNRPFRGCEDTS
jgi:hypothetical protein